jgi:Oxidoreductase family, NAD-binding Rossmann fold
LNSNSLENSDLAVGAIARVLPKLATRKLRMGILGTGRIARLFADGVAKLDTAEIVAVASRKTDTAERFARSAAIPRSVGSYEALVADPDIEAVYVALPNALHAEWAIRGATCGKHVLCETPLALSAAQASAMVRSGWKCWHRACGSLPLLVQPSNNRVAGSAQCEGHRAATTDPGVFRLHHELRR